MEKELLGYESLDLSRPNLANELKVYLQPHQLPLGKDSKTGVTKMVASLGHTSEKSVDLLSQYMAYKVSEPCPDDTSLAQKLILRECKPLPRRGCFLLITGLGIIAEREEGDSRPTGRKIFS
ncbi:hypothetical protein CIPAW_03G109400 [Carya illinoinensis]|uniref:Uncharacterized protein n=1 Tax=Carya illinoinensis TaxID=32201 RepID=A0A8T1R1U3_CARIL|nr:hypothetical protein CIPAW_03G109400 [Carya illinoinensis]